MSKNLHQYLKAFFLMLLPSLAAAAEAESLIPLAVGNYWLYAELDGKGEQIESRVEAVQTFDGIEWYRYYELDTVYWVHNLDDGAQIEAIGHVDRSEMVLPPERVEVVLTVPDGRTRDYLVDSSKVSYLPCAEPLTVPAGTFECHQYTFDLGDGDYSRSYYAPGVGLLRNDMYIAPELTVFELIDFRLN